MVNYISEIINIIILNLPYPMYWKDKHLIYQGANEAFAKYTGLKPQDIIGKTDQQLLNEHAQSKIIAINAKEDREIFNEKKSTHHQFHFSMNGKETILSVHKIPFSELTEQNIGLLAIYIDVEKEKTHKITTTTQPQHISQAPEQMPQHSLSLKNKPSQKIQVLLVEDDALATLMTTRLLEEFNCQVTHTSDEIEVLEQIHQRVFDLIFMDLGLPRQSGEKIAQEIRSRSENPNSKTPIIVLTGHSVLEEHQKYKEAGMQEVIMKPLSTKTAAKLLETYVKTKPVGANGTTEILPAIDLQEGITLLNGNITGAIGGLTLLARSLPRDYKEIQSQYDAKDYSALYQLVLRLYGGLCYCGAPALREASLILKQAILEQNEDLKPFVTRLGVEVERFLQEYRDQQVASREI